MKRRHSMPFGAEVLAGHAVRFQLWAPAAQRVELCLEGPGRQTALRMDRQAGGWFRLETDCAAPGSLYRYHIDGGARVPDPASRFQPHDVHGPSEVVDPTGWDWQDHAWRGRPWEEAVIYELHVGTFTPQGTFRGLEQRLDHLVGLGVTALELMPLGDFPGARNWGYDGVLPFAPESTYGRPEDLKALVQAAHLRGLMVLLDVVYNHFGPEGNYLHLYVPQFFTDRHHTPWGAAINFDGHDSHWVRQFFIENASYWLEEYHLDGLRLDAVHAICDDSKPHILEELADAVQAGPGSSRHVHLVLENDNNAARYLSRNGQGRARWYAAQWNDDVHHALHVLTTGEKTGYYMDYVDDAIGHLGRCLTEGFAYQGEPSPYRNGTPRGEPSRGLPPTAFVSFLQNHDQVGNRAFGERITALALPGAVRAATAILLLAPSPPLLFMGQEWAVRQQFLFFCDFGQDLATSVTEGRRREFAKFPEFSKPEARERIPDPTALETFQNAVLDWKDLENPEGRRWLKLHAELLGLRHKYIVPRLAGIKGWSAGFSVLAERALTAQWQLGDGSQLTLLANLRAEVVSGVDKPEGTLVFGTPEEVALDLEGSRLPGWSVAWFLAGVSGTGKGAR